LRKRNCLLMPTDASLALMSAPEALAQSRGSTTGGVDTTALDEIVVTARRIEENLQSVPVAVTALSGDALRERSFARVEDLQAKLRQVDVLTGQGQSIAEAVKTIAVTETTYFRWRAEYGGMKSDQVKRLKELELETREAQTPSRGDRGGGLR
jgi:hypothetical protein